MKRNLKIKKEEQLNMMAPKLRIKMDEEDKKKENNALQELVTQMPQHEELNTFNINPYSPRHNTYYVSELVRAYQDVRSLAREHLTTSLTIIKILQNSKGLSDDEINKHKLQLLRRKGY
jgi:hypothetical protein